MNSKRTRIAIVGAGPGGLLCARMLQQRGIAVTVYDADPSVSARDLGGSLDLHADSGQIALEDAGLMATFSRLARVEDQAKRGADQNGTITAAFTPAPGDTAAPEIDRGQLRNMLVDAVEPGTIRWGHTLVDITAPESTTQLPARLLSFANGETAEAEFVIGADGTWSRVRRLLTTAVPHYTGVSFLDVRYDEVSMRHPELAETTGAGHLFARDGAGRGFILQRNSNDTIRGYVAFRAAENWSESAGVDFANPETVRRYLVDEFRGWAPSMRRFLTESDSYVQRSFHVLPAPLIWGRVSGVTLIGDAAHGMAPFGGYGANLALLDGSELAQAITEEDDLDAALDRYETAMFARSGPLAVGANGGLDGFFADGAHAMPDQQAEHDRYREAAVAYRTAR